MTLKIQIVSNRIKHLETYAIRPYGSIETFDSFDINIIDLACPTIWVHDESNSNYSNEGKNLESIARMISKSAKSRFVFILPKNIEYKYAKKGPYDYFFKKLLRDNMELMYRILSLGMKINYSIEYEPNITQIKDITFQSDFYFTNTDSNTEKVIYSKDSERIVSFMDKKGNVVTTLSILSSQESIDTFIQYYYGGNTNDYPKWFSEIVFNNDIEIRKDIEKRSADIDSLNEIITQDNKKLEMNDFYKKLLVETGDEMVDVVFDVIKKIFSIDLTNYIDNKKEDFSFTLNGKTFVGEIKGVNENIKNRHISELEHNKQEFIEKKGIDGAKGILIINRERKTRPDERSEINEEQIEYAKKNDLLIIDSVTLLNIFESFLQNKLNIERLLEVLCNSTGLLGDEWRKE